MKLDTGPILLQEQCDVLEEDTVDTLYKRFLYPVGVSAVARAVDLVADGSAPKLIQSEKGGHLRPHAQQAGTAEGKMKNAATLDQITKQVEIEYTPEEKNLIESVRDIWEAILSLDIDDDTDFFAAGAGSMDVVRLVEEVKDVFKTELENDDVFMAPTFSEFCSNVVQKSRGGNVQAEIEYRAIELEVNKMKVRFPCQLFINGEFVDAENGKSTPTINPATEELICDVQCASKNDVDKAVEAAKKAFESGEWSKISARERGQLLFRLADLMQEHKEELATIESIDSGAVYTLALKTHVGMSIETWRYFAGWTDKIQGSTIPVSHARPNRNLSFTKKEPIGVCGLITPWNYPLMMLSWKMAACLAAGNTVLIKPAQVSPLTALKFAELSVKAGIPPGVINVLTGTGVKEGAKLEYGGKRLKRPGYFLEPTVFSNVEDHMYIAKEEAFGPVMIVSRFNNGDIDGVLKRANATEYGLASGVFTKDISKALRFAERVEAGTVLLTHTIKQMSRRLLVDLNSPDLEKIW
ncbi:hypothetical protein NQ314_011193, partial [Rhamnusium bicolor]